MRKAPASATGPAAAADYLPLGLVVGLPLPELPPGPVAPELPGMPVPLPLDVPVLPLLMPVLPLLPVPLLPPMLPLVPELSGMVAPELPEPERLAPEVPELSGIEPELPLPLVPLEPDMPLPGETSDIELHAASVTTHAASAIRLYMKFSLKILECSASGAANGQEKAMQSAPGNCMPAPE